jgi:hypothetical protein
VKITHLGGSRFEMESMSGQKMTVNQNELAQLALVARDYADQLRQNEAGQVTALSTVRVTSGTVSIDRHHTEVILRLREAGGFEQAFCLPHDFAKNMIVGLTNQVNLITETAAKRGKHQ